VGFAGLGLLIVFFVLRFLLAIGGVNTLSFVGKLEAWVSGLLSAALTVALAFLSRKT